MNDKYFDVTLYYQTYNKKLDFFFSKIGKILKLNKRFK